MHSNLQAKNVLSTDLNLNTNLTHMALFQEKQ